MARFSKLKLEEWQQFERVEIEFGDRLTLLTGANASGKTTILNLLARHAGWEQPILATPTIVERTIRFLSRVFGGKDRSGDPKIGHLDYEPSGRADITQSGTNKVNVRLSINNRQNVKCFFLPSHRLVFRYQELPHIPKGKKTTAAAFSEADSAYKQAHQGSGGHPVSYHIKNTIIGWVVQGYGVKTPTHSVMPPDNELVQNFEGFQDVLRQVLPESLGFERLEVREMEVVFRCNDGEDEFLLETASGGITALIDLAWQIFMYASSQEGEFTVILDEIENHLHPSMQRHVLADFLTAFPRANFVVATHSPLVVGSVREARVYALRYNDRRKVESEELDFVEKAKSANEILREVLGLDATLPIWVEHELARLTNKYASMAAEDVDFKAMKAELAAIGLGNLLPDAITRVLEEHD